MTPSITPDGDPSACHCCGRHATGVGVGDPGRGDPKFLCSECLVIIANIKRMRRLDPYELEALDGGVEAVGEFLTKLGTCDLSEIEELDARMLVKAAWMGCADRLRKVIAENEVPF